MLLVGFTLFLFQTWNFEILKYPPLTIFLFTISEYIFYIFYNKGHKRGESSGMTKARLKAFAMLATT